MKNNKSSFFLDFVDFGVTCKTKRFSINTKTGDFIGVIKWHGAWRKYCFFPHGDTVWDSKCLNEILTFISDLMEKRKN